MPKFDEICFEGTCDVCGRKTDVVSCSSTMGACSFSYCSKCLSAGAEPYHAMVSGIASAGKWPDEIGEAYQEIVRNSLKYLGRSEEQFQKDVDTAIKDMDEFFSSYSYFPDRDCQFWFEIPEPYGCADGHCGAYSSSKRNDGRHWSHYPECNEKDCPIKHPELVEDAVLHVDVPFHGGDLF